jgi:nicotinate-nucleotide adenylyltransferase
MEEKKILAIFGGSFNPPLNSHFSLAQQIVNEYENIEKVIFVPVNSKYEKEGLLENEHRYNMLKLVCDKNKDFIVSDIELKQEKQLHTIETLELLQNEYPNNIICFTMGTDNLKEISKWGSSEKLVTDFKILVLERDEDSMDEIIKNDEFLLKYKESFIKLKENIRSNISSTFVREKIKRGKSIRYLTPDEVYYYIKENNLY